MSEPTTAKHCNHAAYQARPIFNEHGRQVAFEYVCGHCDFAWKEATA